MTREDIDYGSVGTDAARANPEPRKNRGQRGVGDKPSTMRELKAADPLDDSDPPPIGFFKARAIRNGPWIPVRVWVDREIDPRTGLLSSNEEFKVMIGGEERPPRRHSWKFWKPIALDEYYEMLDALERNPALKATHVAYDTADNISASIPEG